MATQIARGAKLNKAAIISQYSRKLKKQVGDSPRHWSFPLFSLMGPGTFFDTPLSRTTEHAIMCQPAVASSRNNNGEHKRSGNLIHTERATEKWSSKVECERHQRSKRRRFFWLSQKGRLNYTPFVHVQALLHTHSWTPFQAASVCFCLSLRYVASRNLADLFRHNVLCNRIK